MVILLLLGLLLVSTSIGLVAAATGGERTPGGVRGSLAVLEKMTAAPTELTTEIQRPFGERVLEPLRARSLALGRRLSGANSAERIRRKLDLAGNPGEWTTDRVISTKVLGAIVLPALGTVLGFVLGAGFAIVLLLAVGGLVLGFLLPDLVLYQIAYDRAEKLRRELPDAIDLLTISVEAGLGFDAACQQVARSTDGPVGDEFARMLGEMQIGQSRSEALRGMAERTSVDDLRSFIGAMVQADAFGIPIGQVLRVQSSQIRIKRRQRAETKAQQVPVKITVPLIFFILPCLFAVVMGPAVLSIMDSL